MAQVVPSVARFELKYRTATTTMENVFYVKISDDTWDQATMDAVVNEFTGWEDTNGSLMRNDQTSLYEVIATDLTSLFGIRKAYAVSPVITGALANALPPNVTIACKADIGRRGRGTAGRVFWIGLAEGQILTEGDQIGSASAGLIISGLNTLRDAIAGVTPVEGLCIPHFVVGGLRPPSVSADIVVQYLMSDFTLDSQRDRLPGHKKHKRLPVA
jgi:hypothetical protein